ncbi:MAG: hypothetical protein ABI268_05695 [Rhodanobacter sp.]
MLRSLKRNPALTALMVVILDVNFALAMTPWTLARSSGRQTEHLATIE